MMTYLHKRDEREVNIKKYFSYKEPLLMKADMRVEAWKNLLFDSLKPEDQKLAN
jgi:hypothetical protein